VGSEPEELEQPAEAMDPKAFAKTVLQNCGELRLKHQQVIATERGTGFMRQLEQMRSKNPAATFYGTKSSVARNVFGDTSPEHLESLCATSARAIALANQPGIARDKYLTDRTRAGPNAKLPHIRST
jgi:hypothetical protein